MITPVCFGPICEMSCNLFIAIEHDKTSTRFLSAWGPETKEQIKLAKYLMRFDL